MKQSCQFRCHGASESYQVSSFVFVLFFTLLFTVEWQALLTFSKLSLETFKFSCSSSNYIGSSFK